MSILNPKTLWRWDFEQSGARCAVLPFQCRKVGDLRSSFPGGFCTVVTLRKAFNGNDLLPPPHTHTPLSSPICKAGIKPCLALVKFIAVAHFEKVLFWWDCCCFKPFPPYLSDFRVCNKVYKSGSSTRQRKCCFGFRGHTCLDRGWLSFSQEREMIIIVVIVLYFETGFQYVAQLSWSLLYRPG